MAQPKRKKKKRPKGRYRLCPKGDAVVQETGLLWVIAAIEWTFSHFPFSSWKLMGFLLGCLEDSGINSVHIAVPEWVNPPDIYGHSQYKPVQTSVLITLPAVAAPTTVHWADLQRSTCGSSQVALVVKNPPANAGDLRDAGWIPPLGRSPGGGLRNPLQYSCLDNSMDGRPRQAVHRVLKSQTRLKWLSTACVTQGHLNYN